MGRLDKYKWSIQKNVMGLPSLVGTLLICIAYGTGNPIIWFGLLFLCMAIYSITYDISINRISYGDSKRNRAYFIIGGILVQCAFWMIVMLIIFK